MRQGGGCGKGGVGFRIGGVGESGPSDGMEIGVHWRVIGGFSG